MNQWKTYRKHAPFKQYSWQKHVMSLAFQVAILATIYYFVWDDSFALSYFWYTAIAITFLLNLLFTPEQVNALKDSDDDSQT